MRSEYLPFPTGPGSRKLKSKSKSRINQEHHERKRSTNSIGKKHGIPVYEADICIHQIIKNVIKIIQRHAATTKPMQED